MKPKYRAIITLLLASIFVCAMSVGTLASDNLNIDNSETGVGVMIDDFDNDNYVEIKFIQYDGQQAAFEQYNWRNPTIEMINNEIKGGPWLIYNNFINGELETDSADSIEIRSYSFTDDDFVQIVISCIVLPETIPDLYTKLWSYNFSREDNEYLMLDDVLAGHGLEQNDIYDLFADWYDGDASLVEAQATAFLIEGNIVHFLLEVMMERESDPYKQFCMYTPAYEEFEWLNTFDLFGGMVDASALLLLTADTSAYERTGENKYAMDGLLSVELESFPTQTYDMYNEETLAERILELTDGKAYDIEAALSEEYSYMLTYPAWLITYKTGHNEDTRFGMDLYFQTDGAEYRAHTIVHADSAEEYTDIINALFQSLDLEEPNFTYDDVPNMYRLLQGISEDEAMELLADAVYYRLEEGLTLVSYGLGYMDEKPCWQFAFGDDSPEKFTALEHYMVTLDGEIFVLNMDTGEYEPFAFE